MIFLIYKEIQMGSIAKSYMRNASKYVRKCANIYFTYEEAVRHI